MKWQEYDIENSFETPADAFSMRIGIPDGTIVPLINEGATCTVRIDGKLILTGFIDRIEHSLTKFNHSFSINGRDKGRS
ncbi:phage baseplate assembly protein [Ignatzschineria indica]|uniref:phage baseplate assembly protein n=1 Tax=Ignatzschineria indica TaxID=472583 RepID=UPI00362F7262